MFDEFIIVIFFFLEEQLLKEAEEKEMAKQLKLQKKHLEVNFNLQK